MRQRDRWLLEGSSWQINEGELWAVVGPNGAGKTTLAKAIAGLLPVVKGNIHYPGFSETFPASVISYVASDDRRKLWRMERDLDFGRSFSGRFGETTLVRDWLDAVPGKRPAAMDKDDVQIVKTLRLGRLLDKPVTALSTGEMSRVLLGRELYRHPKLLILDEPFDGIDGAGRNELREILDRMAVSGLPMILITHRSEEMLAATTHVLTVENGNVLRSEPAGRSQSDAENHCVPPFSCGEPPNPFSAKNRAKISLSSEPMIEMDAVTVRYGETIVLDQIDWTVRKGEHWAVVGPSGAGKSTLLKLITGDCLQVYANRIRLFGRDRGREQTLWEIRRHLGVVNHELSAGYQKPMTAFDVVCSGFFDSIGLYRHCDAAQVQTARQWMDRLDISALSRMPFNHLSRGQRQIILITRAIVKSPRLLILDEPCAGLDPENRKTILRLIAFILCQGSTGVIFVTHHGEEIPANMTHRLMLRHGTVVNNV